MSQILPLDRIRPAPEEAFRLSLPNPILGRSHFLILPLNAGWVFKALEERTRARRHFILADRMWVAEGEAEFEALREGDARLQVQLTVRRGPPSRAFWRNRKTHLSLGSHPALEPAPLFSWFPPGRNQGRKNNVLFYCENTERRLELRWETENKNLQQAWLDVLKACRCH